MRRQEENIQIKLFAISIFFMRLFLYSQSQLENICLVSPSTSRATPSNNFKYVDVLSNRSLKKYLFVENILFKEKHFYI